jgi:gliding motility-associated-like protein
LKKIFFLTCLFLSLATSSFYAQCGNVGFENGDNTGWCGISGTSNLGPTTPANSLPTYTFTGGCVPWTTPQYYTHYNNDAFPSVWDTAWQIMSPNGGNNGFDPYVPAIPVVSPWGQGHSIRLGSTVAGGHAERIRYTYAVTNQNANLVYQYAVVLDNDGGHASNEQPTFRIKVTTSNGTLINPTCGQYNIFAGQSGVGFDTATAPDGHKLSYRNWTLSSLDLTPYIGQNVFIEFTAGDCVYSAHYGYAYIDCSCIPLTLATNYCSGSATADVMAPNGYVSYSWVADASVSYPPPTGPIYPIGSILTTNQTLQVASDDTTTTYTVNLIPYQGLQCATHLNYVFNPVPTLTAHFDFLAFCGNTPSEFTENSIVMNNGQPPTDWHWFFGDGDSSHIQNPIHNFPVLSHDTAYHVQLIVYAGASCKDTVDTMVFIPSGLDIDTSGIYGFRNVKCAGENNGIAQIKVTGSPGAAYVYNWIIPTSSSTAQPSSNEYMAYGLIPNLNTNPLQNEYWFKIKDTVNGCRDSVHFVIREPLPLNSSIADSYIGCAQGTGSLTAVVNGGVPPYYISWTTPTPQNGPTANSIPAGTYSINVIDSNLCTSNATGHLIDGSSLHHNLYTTDVSCNGFNDGTAAIHLYGGIPPYTITWNINGQTLPTQNVDTSFLPSLPRFTNYVIIGNTNGCLNDTIPFTIHEPDTMNAIVTSSPTACRVAQNGAIKVDVVGGTQPYTYLWAETLKNTQGMKDIMEGTYHVTITDAHNCVYDTAGVVGYDSDFVATAVPDFVYDSAASGQLWVTLSQTRNYSYKWSNSEYLLDADTISSPRLKEMFFPQEFRVDVIDQYGCTAFDSVFVDVTPNVFTPSAFTPNGDKINDTLTFAFSNYRISNFEIRIYDRWGAVVFQSNDPKFKWDGNGANIGTYNFNISYIDNRKKHQLKNGIIALIR